MATEKQILSKMRLIERLMGLPKTSELNLFSRTRGSSTVYYVYTPYKQLTPFMTRAQLYKTLDTYVKGMEDFKNRIKLRKRY